MTAFYNEIDPFAAAWLRELIKDGLIAEGVVDERSIEDIRPDELMGYTQCHFFAGVGAWSLALRQAGWPDDAPIWTGSCPCQPFSAAGKGGGFADERHLWPHLHYLIEQCQPGVVVGEQVASKDGLAWLDLVQTDLEATGYASGAVDTCAAGFGAPHIRQRLYWVAYSASGGRKSRARIAGVCNADNGKAAAAIECGAALPLGGLADAERLNGEQRQRFAMQRGWSQRPEQVGVGERIDGMADANGGNASAERKQCGGQQRQQPQDGGAMRVADANLREHEQFTRKGAASGETKGGRAFCKLAGHGNDSHWPSPTNGYWRDADWLRCTDEKWRAVEPGTFPLADAGTVRNRVGGGGRESREEVEARVKEGRFYNRVGLLRGAGNAVTLGQAEGFLRAVMDSLR